MYIKSTGIKFKYFDMDVIPKFKKKLNTMPAVCKGMSAKIQFWTDVTQFGTHLATEDAMS